MNFQTTTRVIDPQNYFATVSLPFPAPVGDVIAVPASRRRVRARPRRARLDGSGGIRVVARKILVPCLAALVVGKALSYFVQFSAFLLFLLN
jgi:hypothetical protein